MKYKITLVYTIARDYEIEASTRKGAEDKTIEEFKRSIELFREDEKLVSYYCLKQGEE